MKFSRSQVILFSVISIGSILFLFVLAKSCVSSFTHDESISYLNYTTETFMEIISYNNWYTNNHVLNSLFMKYAGQLFGSSEIALRSPNLLLLIIYMVYSYWLFRHTNSLLTVAVFSLMCTNCLLMDLFGLARGYGLSCGFMLMSLYHFIEFIKNSKPLNLALFHAAALLSCLSNFTLLTFYLASMLVYNLVAFIYARFIIDAKYGFLKSNKLHIIPLFLVIIVLFEPVRRLLTYNTLDFGGKTGFYQDTVTALILNIFHGIKLPWLALGLLQVIFTCLLFISASTIVYMIIRKNKPFFEHNMGLIVSCFLLILISVIVILLHLVLGADYPIARFSIFLFPLFMVHLGFLVHYLRSLKYDQLMHTVIFGVALALMINFWRNANLKSSIEWDYDRHTKDMIQALVSHREENNHGGGNVELGINWLFEPTVNFYRVTKGIDWLLPVDRNGISRKDDYCYIFSDELNQLDCSGYEIIEEYKDIKTLLIVNLKGTHTKRPP